MKKKILLILLCAVYAYAPAQTVTEFTKGQLATIILPTTPNAELGRYYRLDRWENEQIVFEEELHPQARTPYIIVPNEDFSIDLNTPDVEGLIKDTAKIEGVNFIGTYLRNGFGVNDSDKFYIIDTTPDCYLDREKQVLYLGALRAFLAIRYKFCYNWKELKVVFNDITSSVEKNAVLLSDKRRILFDLQGRKLPERPARGIYIENGKKKAE